MHRVRARFAAARERFWVLPGCAIALAVAAGVLVPLLDDVVTLPEWLSITGRDESARAALAAIVTLGVSVAGVSFSVLAVALVLASQQLSPRVLRSFQRQSINQAVLAVLLGSATYALFVLSQVGEGGREAVPELSVTLAMALAALSLALFSVFLHHALRSLNASVVIRRIAAEGHASITTPYPVGAGEEPEDPAAAERAANERRERGRCIDVHAPRAGYVAAIDGAAVVAWAAEHDALVVQRRGVGAFAVTGALLAQVFLAPGRVVDPEPVVAAFDLDEERVVEGDIAFPVRQLADVALKGLSPGVNDPTTSENAMDSVTDTLVRFARRDPVSELRMGPDGVPRLLAVAPGLDDLVRLGFDQVRRDAADRPSFAVRLLELLADLRGAAPAARDSREIARQAELIRAHAADRAGVDADRRFVLDAHRRLHGAPAGGGAAG